MNIVTKLLDALKLESTPKSDEKSLLYYKDNFYELDDIERGFYNNDLKLKLDHAKTLSHIINNTKDIIQFTEALNEIIKIFTILSEHEFTGSFHNTPPSYTLEDLKINRFFIEIAFIKRAFPASAASRNKLKNKSTKYLFSHFTPEAIDYFITGKNYLPIDIKHKQNSMPDFDQMGGQEFEFFCADVLKKNGFSNISITRGSGDQGIDIIAFKDEVKYGIQCKCYSSDIGNKAVQEAFAGKTFYNCHVAVVLTNRHFTPSAKELAEKSGVLLWDRERLLELINNSKQ